jgi:hypothetical protein
MADKTHTAGGAERSRAIRARRLKEDARRSPEQNLAETIALSHKLMQIQGLARGSR